MDKETAILFILGLRPSGGPYTAIIEDDSRFLTNKEYRLTVTLSEQVETYDAEGRIDYEDHTERFSLSQEAIYAVIKKHWSEQ